MNFDVIPHPLERKVPQPSWRPPGDVRLISADDHNMEKEHLWEERLPAKFQDRAPKLWNDPKTGWHMEVMGRSFDVPGGSGGSGVEQMPGYADRDARLRAMDSEGIEISILYHGRLQSLNALIAEQKDLYWACIDVYNEWLAEFTKPAEKRLLGVPVLPTFLEPAATRDYLQKLKDLGFKALQMPSFPRGVRYNSSSMDPVWSAIEESGFPLSFHVTATIEFQGRGSWGANVTRNMSPFRPLLAQLMFSGMFERHPQLKVVFTEGGAGWVADAILGMDKVCREYYTQLSPKLEHLPSFYWKRQCHATFMDDPVALLLHEIIGADNMMWSLDYPHAEGVHGYAGEVAKRIYDALGHERAKKVLGGNAARVWGL
jgi:predicted TIM-barrel fold metal-dependent hydrolase